MAGFIKLHRDVVDHPVWQNDPTAWRVFEYLLCKVDRTTANWSRGLYQFSADVKLKKATLYSALKRLEQAGMVKRTINSQQTDVKRSSNKDFTTFTVVNWGKWQGSSNSQQTDVKQPSNERQNYNKKEEGRRKNITNADALVGARAQFLALTADSLTPFKEKFPRKDVKTEYEKAADYLRSTGKKYQDYTAFFRAWLRRADDTVTAAPIVPPPKIDPQRRAEYEAMKQRLMEERYAA